MRFILGRWQVFWTKMWAFHKSRKGTGDLIISHQKGLYEWNQEALANERQYTYELGVKSN
jgi:hypothetical protein